MSDVTPIEIMRTGTFTSVEGEQHTYTSADLASFAAAYDPAVFESPLVVGHPELDTPAYGWVDRLEVQDDVLVAIPKQVDASFAEIVNSGRFKKVSASFYPADHPFNPAPGKTYLKHVGFLGAAAPAVKGLKSVSFSEEQATGAITFDLDVQEKDVTDKTKEQITASFAEREAELARREAALGEREASIDDREKQAKEAAQAARHAASVSFAETQVNAGKLAPAGKGLVVGLLDLLDSATAVSFGEGDANQLTPAAAFKKLFDGAQPIVSFGELAGRDTEPADSVAPAEIAAKAQSYAEAEVAAGRPRPSATQAVNHVKKQMAAEA